MRSQSISSNNSWSVSNHRTLREARDGACAERERMLARHKELDEKHTQLVTE